MHPCKSQLLPSYRCNVTLKSDLASRIQFFLIARHNGPTKQQFTLDTTLSNIAQPPEIQYQYERFSGGKYNEVLMKETCFHRSHSADPVRYSVHGRLRRRRTQWTSLYVTCCSLADAVNRLGVFGWRNNHL